MKKIIHKIKELYSNLSQKLGAIFIWMNPSQPKFNLDVEYFQDAPDDITEFMWEHGIERLGALEKSYRINKDNSAKLLNLLLAGAGGAAVLLIKDAQAGCFYAGLIILVLGWACCSLYLIKMCVETKKHFSIIGSPTNVYVNDNIDPSKKMALPKIKRYVLYNISKTIYEMEFLVAIIAKNLDKTRRWAAYVAIAATVVSLIVYLFT